MVTENPNSGKGKATTKDAAPDQPEPFTQSEIDNLSKPQTFGDDMVAPPARQDAQAGTTFDGDFPDPEAKPAPAPTTAPDNTELSMTQAASISQTSAQDLTKRRDTKEEVAAGEKLTVVLPERYEGQPDWEAWINGVPYKIKRNRQATIPYALYAVLVSSGEVEPQRPQDFHLKPQHTKPGMVQGSF